ncbi:MAG: hypothetical protein IPK85_09005 [Gemmatimonadetes bacterium]|nr:hypothetical protein [Gemmatimonadota bacterium]
MSQRTIERAVADSTRHTPRAMLTKALLARAAALRDATRLPWKDVASILSLAPSALAMRRRRASAGPRKAAG